MLKNNKIKPPTIRKPSTIQDLINNNDIYNQVCLNCANNPQAKSSKVKLSKIECEEENKFFAVSVKLVKERSRETGVPSSCYFCSSIMNLAKATGYDISKFLEETNNN